jgi:5'-nucleotidase (lipoprotein e(P4) family)
MRKYILFAFFPLLLGGCQNQPKSDEFNYDQEHLVLATLWFQNSPEMEALYYQGFNIAKERVLEFSSEKGLKPKAVVVDLDETMINNSPFQGKMIESGKPFTSDFWNEWSALASAQAMPGAIEFTHFCDSLNVEVFYISNRSVSELESTMKNLEKLDFAFVKAENFLLKEAESGKEPRRLKISENYDIVLLLGDNLNDFSNVFENRGDDWGVSIVNTYKNQLGKRFILFPNPLYGEWEKTIYEHKKNLTEEERFKLRRKALKTF